MTRDKETYWIQRYSMGRVETDQIQKYIRTTDNALDYKFVCLLSLPSVARNQRNCISQGFRETVIIKSQFVGRVSASTGRKSQ